MQEHQSILTNAELSKESDLGIVMVVYEKILLYYFQGFKEVNKCMINIIL